MLGVRRQEEARVEKLLEVQKEIDELRAEYAETLRKVEARHPRSEAREMMAREVAVCRSDTQSKGINASSLRRCRC
eukprot:830667-Rhodomonas_salina.1